MRVALVRLGRPHATGESRRATNWHALLEAAGADVTDITLRGRVPIRPRLGDIPSVLRANLVPESQAWSLARARATIDAVDPDMVIFMTLRAFHPDLCAKRRATLDYVDMLSASYRDRSQLSHSRLARLGLRGLATMHRNSERLPRDGFVRVAAGRGDADALHCWWLPNVGLPTASTRQGRSPDIDVGFVGSLSYPPNVDALGTLGQLWPRLQARRPGTTCVIAGARPPELVLSLARRHRWEVMADFEDLSSVYARVRVSVSPLRYASGIQNKVIDAASQGVAQVVSSAALRGLDDAFPLRPYDDLNDVCGEIVRLLDDPVARGQAVQVASDHVQRLYSTQRWAPWVRQLLHGSLPPFPP